MTKICKAARIGIAVTGSPDGPGTAELPLLYGSHALSGSHSCLETQGGSKRHETLCSVRAQRWLLSRRWRVSAGKGALHALRFCDFGRVAE